MFWKKNHAESEDSARMDWLFFAMDREAMHIECREPIKKNIYKISINKLLCR